jgi:hypothetical protein
VRRVCPACGGTDVHHSRRRSWVERIRSTLTTKVPFRCHACGWRGWRLDGPTAAADPPQPIQDDLTDAELDRLDEGESK